MFFYKVEGHMPKLSSFGRGKTIRPKKSLTSLLHAALQLLPGYLHLRFGGLIRFQRAYFQGGGGGGLSSEFYSNARTVTVHEAKVCTVCLDHTVRLVHEVRIWHTILVRQYWTQMMLLCDFP